MEDNDTHDPIAAPDPDLDALARSSDTTFDWLTRLAARLMDAPIAAVSLIGRDRQWFVSSVGIEMEASPQDTAFSSLAIATPDEVFVVSDTALDERFTENPVVTGAPFVRAYAAMPICSREGLPIGTLSVIDTEPREFTDEEIRFLKALSFQAEALFDSHRRAGTLDDLIGEHATELHADTHLSAVLGRSSVEPPGGPAATIARVRRRALAAGTHDHTTVEEAVGVVIGLVRDLGGSTIPARLGDRDALPAPPR